MLKTTLIAIMLLGATVAHAQNLSPVDRQPGHTHKGTGILNMAGRTSVNAPEVKFNSDGVLIDVCGDYRISVNVGAPNGLALVKFVIKSDFAAIQRIPAVSVGGGVWEADWVMPCNEEWTNTYEVKAVAVGTDGSVGVGLYYPTYLRP